MRTQWRVLRAALRTSGVIALGAMISAPPAALAAPGVKATQPSMARALGTTPLALRLQPGHQGVLAIQSTGSADVDYGLLGASLVRSLGGAKGDAARSKRVETTYEVMAELHWRVVGQDASGPVLAARLAGLDYRVDGTPDARQALMEVPFLLNLDASGRIRSFEFPRQYPQTLKSAVRGLVEPLQTVLAEGLSTWGSKEQVTEGPQDVRYDLMGVDQREGTALLQRRKLAMKRADLERDAEHLPGRLQTRIHRADATVHVDLATGFPVKVVAVEDTATHAGVHLLAQHRGHYTAERVSSEVAGLPSDLDEARTKLSDRSFARARLYDVEPRILSAVQGMRMADALEAHRVTVRESPAASMRLLEGYLRLHPEESDDFLEVLASMTPDGRVDEEVGFAYAALASAGHVEAQQALVRAISEPGYSATVRERALISAVDVELPEAFLLDAVWTLRESIAPTNGAEAMTLSIATNVFGALGHVELGNPEVTEEVVGKLAGLLSGAGGDMDRVLALDALSNVGDFALVAPLAASAFSASDPGVRASAFHTFRRMPEAQAFEAFAERFAAETDPAVLREAAEVARQMPETDARNAWATQVAMAGYDRDVKTSAVHILGRGMESFPGNEAALRSLLDQTSDRRLRREIYTYVAPQR